MAQRRNLPEAVVDQEDLHEERGSAKDLDMRLGNPPQRHNRTPGGSDDQHGEQEADRKRQGGELQGEGDARQQLTEDIQKKGPIHDQWLQGLARRRSIRVRTRPVMRPITKNITATVA